MSAGTSLRKVAPCLWFDDQAEAAACFYVGLLPDSRIDQVSRYGEGGPYPAGTALMVEFTLAGQRYQALNGGSHVVHSDAVSFSIDCVDQAEVEHYWSALVADGGTEGRCGWLKDRFGVSWQVVPRGLGALLSDADPGRRARAMQAMLGMRKLDLVAMRAAADSAGGER